MIVMKLLKELILKKNLKKVGSTLLKVVDNAALGGAITKTTQETGESPAGSIPYLEIISSLVPVILLAAVLGGLITIEELQELLKLF